MPARPDRSSKRPSSAPARAPGPVHVRPPAPPMRGRPPPRLAIGVRIVHEDADVLVVDKAPGLITANMPGETRDSVFDFVKQHVRRRRKSSARVWIIHRLDKEASGLLVFAKSEKAFEWLKEDFRSKRVHRLYLAVVEGEMTPAQSGGAGNADAGAGEGTIQNLLIETRTGRVRSIDPARFRSAARPAHGPDAPKPAITHFRVLASGKGRSLLQVRLQTGRKHQIRAHMSESGHPIVGDSMYDAGTDPIGRLALHATELGFTHPTTGQMARFHSQAPRSFYQAVGQKPPVRAEPDAPPPRQPPRAATAHAETSWDQVADWYDELVEGSEPARADHHARVILPGALRLLRAKAGMKVLDIACGQGSLCRELAALGVLATGVDASPRLIEAAQRRTPQPQDSGGPRFLVADARTLGESEPVAGLGPFDAAACVMALMNMDPLEPILRGAFRLLAPGGVFVAILLHPAFRAPRQTSWGWDGPRQFRRVDGYLSPGQTEIVMNPGQAAHGKPPITTWTFHRPLQSYAKGLADAGFLIETIEEWPSLRQSEPGPRSAEENRARREFPMFLGIRAMKPESARPG